MKQWRDISFMKKHFKKFIQHLPFLVASLSSIISIIVFLILDIKEGWTGSKTISYSFMVIMMICWLALYPSMYVYLISNNPRTIKANNDLFLAIEEIERIGKLSSYKQIKYNQSRKKQLSKINGFLSSKNKSFTFLNHDELKTFMETKAYLNKPLCLSFDDKVELNVLYAEYNEKFSKDYEKLFSDYKTMKLIQRESFPLFSTILPFILSALGLFGLIYQDINAVENQHNVLMIYIILMAEIVLFGTLTSVILARNSVPDIVKENQAEIDIINSLMVSSSEQGSRNIDDASNPNEETVVKESVPAANDDHKQENIISSCEESNKEVANHNSENQANEDQQQTE